MNFNNEITDPNEGINAKINLLRNIPYHMSDIEIFYEIEDIETALEPDQPPLSEQTIENIRNLKKQIFQSSILDKNRLNSYQNEIIFYFFFKKN